MHNASSLSAAFVLAIVLGASAAAQEGAAPQRPANPAQQQKLRLDRERQAEAQMKAQMEKARRLDQMEQGRETVEQRIAGGEAQVAAIKAVAAAENRPLTPAEERRVAMVSSMIAQARTNQKARQEVMQAQQAERTQQKMRNELKQTQRRRPNGFKADPFRRPQSR